MTRERKQRISQRFEELLDKYVHGNATALEIAKMERWGHLRTSGLFKRQCSCSNPRTDYEFRNTMKNFGKLIHAAEATIESMTK